MAASRHGAWEQSENVRSIFISILPPHLAPVTWLSVSGSRGVQRGLVNEMSLLCLAHHPCAQSSAHLGAVIEEAVTGLEVGMDHFPQRTNGPSQSSPL